MIVLDTNVLPECMREAPDERAIAWLDRQPARSLWTSAVTVFEVAHGLQRLRASKRRRRLEEQFRALLEEDLEGRVLPFDQEAGLRSAELAVRSQADGVSVDFRGLQIAGIARVNGAIVATRNVKHFAGSCEVVDPWGG